MSHQPERKEKNCLNCGTLVQGRYCHVCGQENIVTHQGFWALCRHFVYDVLHYDGKFMDTFKNLLLRPGLVPQEYVKGKRQSYLDPIRMYLFTSAVFFLIFFSIKKPEAGLGISGANDFMTKQQRLNRAAAISREIDRGANDSSLKEQLVFLLDTAYSVKFTRGAIPAQGDTSFPVNVDGQPYWLVADEIELEHTDSTGKSWMGRKAKATFKKLRLKYGDDNDAIFSAVSNSFVHKFPYMLFISLPFFALTLKLLYARRKNFFYSDHAVFTLYNYIFVFILMLFFFLFDSLQDWTRLQFFTVLRVILLISGISYLYIAMKKYYMQGWAKTLLKFAALNFLALIGFVSLAIIFGILSFFQV